VSSRLLAAALAIAAATLASGANRPARPARTEPAPERAKAAHERTYEALKPSLYTIEIHSGNANAKSTLGSAYLVSREGHLVTNYHVIGSYVDDPGRYHLRAKSASGVLEARLLSFDLVNDLALLQVEGAHGTPLRIAPKPPQSGSAIVAFGDPEGYGLALVEGIFNGYSEKGLVDRMLLSMPLNSGMSGGPILNGAGEVIGTNVSVQRESNSLSFGVPAGKIAALFRTKPLETDRKALREETRRQLALLERETTARVLHEFDAMGEAVVRVGGAEAPRPPAFFECWDDSQLHKEEAITKSVYSCNLQFTPSVEGLGEVAAVTIQVEHFAVTRNAFGFFGWLPQHATSHNTVSAIDPKGENFSPPHCAAERIQMDSTVWTATTCASSYVEHDGIFDFDLMATSVSRSDDVMYVSLQMSGFRLETFERLARRLLERVRAAKKS